MRAIHLPGLSETQEPPFSFLTRPPTATALHYTTSEIPIPHSPSLSGQAFYLLQVHTTALTRQELTWEETLLPRRFGSKYGPIPGHDVVATIAEVFKPSGSSLPVFKAGDKVLALLAFDRDGAAAEYTIAAEDELAMPPSSLSASNEELATVPLSGLSAWQSLFEHGGISDPLSSSPPAQDTVQKPVVLVTGASGTVGVMAVQLAKAAGCTVIATSSANNADFVRGLGADVVIDYSKFASVAEALVQTEVASNIEIVLDAVGGQTLYSLYRLAAFGSNEASKTFIANVHFVSVGCPLAALVPMTVCSNRDLQEVESAAKEKGMHFTFFVVRPDGTQLSKILGLMTDGKLKGFVRSGFDLEKGKEAMELVEGRGGKGKVVLKVS